jgi:suppressor of fused
MADEVNTAGWDAIDRALEPLYGDQEPRHYGTIIKYRLGGPDPLDGISIYRSEAGRPHWHYVTYGYSELYAKESDNAEESGWGLEMTFRLARAEGEPEPPAWPLSFLNNLSRYVFKTGNVFDVGHHLDLNGPIALGEETAIRSTLFALDPQLPPIDTPNGRLKFLQCVGITDDEREAAEEWNAGGFLDVLARKVPLLITDLRRRSVREDAETAAALNEGSRREGSTTAATYVSALDWKAGRKKPALRLTVGARGAGPLRRLLPLRLPFGYGFGLAGPGKYVDFRPAAALNWEVGKDRLQLSLPPPLVAAIAADLQPRRGVYSWPGFEGFSIEVVPSEITDAEGKVIEVVG